MFDCMYVHVHVLYKHVHVLYSHVNVYRMWLEVYCIHCSFLREWHMSLLLDHGMGYGWLEKLLPSIHVV